MISTSIRRSDSHLLNPSERPSRPEPRGRTVVRVLSAILIANHAHPLSTVPVRAQHGCVQAILTGSTIRACSPYNDSIWPVEDLPRCDFSATFILCFLFRRFDYLEVFVIRVSCREVFAHVVSPVHVGRQFLRSSNYNGSPDYFRVT